jgi:mannose-6-phosphate isomerase
VPGGRVHAIDAGCLILEIQQNSNTTYRVYDWGRVGADGKSREPHVEKALAVIDFADEADPSCAPETVAPGVRNICTSPFFVLDELTVKGEGRMEASGETFHVLFSAAGGFAVEYGRGEVEKVARGVCVLIPAGLGAYCIRSEAEIKVLQTRVPPILLEGLTGNC